jgi:hypothetical protein
VSVAAQFWHNPTPDDFWPSLQEQLIGLLASISAVGQGMQLPPINLKAGLQLQEGIRASAAEVSQFTHVPGVLPVTIFCPSLQEQEATPFVMSVAVQTVHFPFSNLNPGLQTQEARSKSAGRVGSQFTHDPGAVPAFWPSLQAHVEGFLLFVSSVEQGLHFPLSSFVPGLQTQEARSKSAGAFGSQFTHVPGVVPAFWPSLQAQVNGFLLFISSAEQGLHFPLSSFVPGLQTQEASSKSAGAFGSQFTHVPGAVPAFWPSLQEQDATPFVMSVGVQMVHFPFSNLNPGLQTQEASSKSAGTVGSQFTHNPGAVPAFWPSLQAQVNGFLLLISSTEQGLHFPLSSFVPGLQTQEARSKSAGAFGSQFTHVPGVVPAFWPSLQAQVNGFLLFISSAEQGLHFPLSSFVPGLQTQEARSKSAGAFGSQFTHVPGVVPAFWPSLQAQLDGFLLFISSARQGLHFPLSSLVPGLQTHDAISKSAGAFGSQFTHVPVAVPAFWPSLQAQLGGFLLFISSVEQRLHFPLSSFVPGLQIQDARSASAGTVRSHATQVPGAAGGVAGLCPSLQEQEATPFVMSVAVQTVHFPFSNLNPGLQTHEARSKSAGTVGSQFTHVPGAVPAFWPSLQAQVNGFLLFISSTRQGLHFPLSSFVPGLQTQEARSKSAGAFGSQFTHVPGAVPAFWPSLQAQVRGFLLFISSIRQSLHFPLSSFVPGLQRHEGILPISLSAQFWHDPSAKAFCPSLQAQEGSSLFVKSTVAHGTHVPSVGFSFCPDLQTQVRGVLAISSVAVQETHTPFTDFCPSLQAQEAGFAFVISVVEQETHAPSVSLSFKPGLQTQDGGDLFVLSVSVQGVHIPFTGFWPSLQEQDIGFPLVISLGEQGTHVPPSVATSLFPGLQTQDEGNFAVASEEVQGTHSAFVPSFCPSLQVHDVGEPLIISVTVHGTQEPPFTVLSLFPDLQTQERGDLAVASSSVQEMQSPFGPDFCPSLQEQEAGNPLEISAAEQGTHVPSAVFSLSPGLQTQETGDLFVSSVAVQGIHTPLLPLGFWPSLQAQDVGDLFEISDPEQGTHVPSTVFNLSPGLQTQDGGDLFVSSIAVQATHTPFFPLGFCPSLQAQDVGDLLDISVFVQGTHVPSDSLSFCPGLQIQERGDPAVASWDVQGIHAPSAPGFCPSLQLHDSGIPFITSVDVQGKHVPSDSLSFCPGLQTQLGGDLAVASLAVHGTHDPSTVPGFCPSLQEQDVGFPLAISFGEQKTQDPSVGFSFCPGLHTQLGGDLAVASLARQAMQDPSGPDFWPSLHIQDVGIPFAISEGVQTMHFPSESLNFSPVLQTQLGGDLAVASSSVQAMQDPSGPGFWPSLHVQEAGVPLLKSLAEQGTHEPSLIFSFCPGLQAQEEGDLFATSVAVQGTHEPSVPPGFCPSLQEHEAGLPLAISLAVQDTQVPSVSFNFRPGLQIQETGDLAVASKIVQGMHWPSTPPDFFPSLQEQEAGVPLDISVALQGTHEPSISFSFNPGLQTQDTGDLFAASIAVQAIHVPFVPGFCPSLQEHEAGIPVNISVDVQGSHVVPLGFSPVLQAQLAGDPLRISVAVHDDSTIGLQAYKAIPQMFLFLATLM